MWNICPVWWAYLFSNTYLAITLEVYIAVGFFKLICAKMLGLYAHLICWLCDLDMQCSSNICSVIYAYMKLML